MSFVGEKKRALVLDLLRGRIADSEFYREFGIKPGQGSAAGLEMLRRAAEVNDPVGVEFGLYLAHRFGVSEDYLDVLVELAMKDWHERHEDVVDALAKLKAPRAMDVLFRLAIANLPYRAYDDAKSLGVKCVYALAAIPSVDALGKLAELRRIGNAIVADEAERQLGRIATSSSSPEMQEVAANILRGKSS